MRCPVCDNPAVLVVPDYGYGYGTVYECTNCHPYGRRFASYTAEALADSDRVRNASRANAGKPPLPPRQPPRDEP